MGGIHPRLKQPVGQRLAMAAFSVVYNGSTPAGGPTVSGCQYSPATTTAPGSNTVARVVNGPGAATLTVKFSGAQLAGETVAVQPYNKSTVLEPIGGLSAFQVHIQMC